MIFKRKNFNVKLLGWLVVVLLQLTNDSLSLVNPFSLGNAQKRKCEEERKIWEISTSNQKLYMNRLWFKVTQKEYKGSKERIVER